MTDDQVNAELQLASNRPGLSPQDVDRLLQLITQLRQQHEQMLEQIKARNELLDSVIKPILDEWAENDAWWKKGEPPPL